MAFFPASIFISRPAGRREGSITPFRVYLHYAVLSHCSEFAPGWAQEIRPTLLFNFFITHTLFLILFQIGGWPGAGGFGDGGGGAEQSEVLLPASQPALLSLGADGVIRVWVEVTLAPSLGADSKAVPRSPGPVPPAGPASHFCCTLVIQVSSSLPPPARRAPPRKTKVRRSP